MSQISRFITGANALDIVADSGTGSPQNDTLEVLGGTNVTTSISGNTVTINSSGGVTSPTFEGDGGGTASPSSGVLQMAGGLNLTSSASGDTVTYDMDNNISSLDSVRFNTGGALQSDQTAGNTYTLDAYDTNLASYVSFLTLTAGNPPTADLSTSVTQGGTTIYRVGGQDVALADGGTGIDASGVTDGQLLIGGTASNDLQLSTLTAGSNISITNGTNSITIAASSTGTTSFEGDGGGTATPSSGVIQMDGGLNITSSASTDTVTYALDQTLTNMNVIELNKTDTTGSVGVISMENGSNGSQERIIHCGDNASASGLQNFFAGARAGNFTATGTFNTGIGKSAMQLLTASAGNTAVGNVAAGGLDDPSPSGSNVAVGNNVLREVYGGTTPRRENVGIGPQSLRFLTDNEANTAVGYSALKSVVDGTRNTALGHQAGISLDGSDTDNIIIGNTGTSGDNNTIRIGNSSDHDVTFIAGIQGVTPSGTSEVTIIDNNNQLGSEAQLGLARGGTGVDASAATDGQLLIGGTASNDLQLSTLTGGNNLTVTNGTNSITLDVDGTVADTFSADSGTATPSSGSLTIAGGTNVTTSGSGSTVTIDASSSGGTALSWTVLNSATPMQVNDGYILDSNTGSNGDYTLPPTASPGDRVAVAGYGPDLFDITQNAGQTIHFSGMDTTTGSSGFLTSTTRYDAIELICVVTDTEWVVRSAVGNFDVT